MKGKNGKKGENQLLRCGSDLLNYFFFIFAK